MSHTSRLAGVNLGSKAMLELAVEELNKQGIKCRLSPDMAPRMYFDQKGRGAQFRANAKSLFGRELQVADLCLELLDGKYDVGLVWSDDSQNYEPVFDSHAGYVSSFLGSRNPKDARAGSSGKEGDIGKLLQEYSKCQIQKAMQDQGFSVCSCELDASGQYQFTYSG